ncbi:hypothetical protein OROHE_019513 [Orobanche hederae]
MVLDSDSTTFSPYYKCLYLRHSDLLVTGTISRPYMAQNDSFKADLLLGQHHNWTDIIKSGDTYFIDETDQLTNVFHGKLFDGIDSGAESGFRMVTFLVFEDVSRASKMRKHLDSLSRLASLSRLTSVRVVKAYCVSKVKVGIRHPSVLNIGSMEVEMQKDVQTSMPCLVIERVSSITFDRWIESASVGEQLQFFRSLFSTVGCFHKKCLYFGNIKLGIRIIANFPMFVFPAVFEETKLDQGIRSDLKELQEMIQLSTFPRHYDRELFDRLCQKFAHNVDCNGESLRDASYLITHCPIVHLPTDRFNIIKRLWMYAELNRRAFDILISDTPSIAIPTNFLERVSTAKTARQLEKIEKKERRERRTILTTSSPGSDEALSFKKVLSRGNYDSSSDILTFIRDSYEHKPEKNKTWLDVEAMLYVVFPDAYSAIYDMMISRLYYRHSTQEVTPTMPPIIQFLQAEGEPYRFEF